MPHSVFDCYLQLRVLFGVYIFEGLMEVMPCVAVAVHVVDPQGHRRVDGVCGQNMLIASLGVTAITMHYIKFRDAMRWFGP